VTFIHQLIPSDPRERGTYPEGVGNPRSRSLAWLGMRYAVGVSLLFTACKKEAPPPAYQAVPVERRDIVVSAQASGAVQPDTTVEVKSKASGEVLQVNVETGQVVQRGAPLVRIDPRNARNALAQAQADLDVAKAKLTNSTSQK
jgi:HlyD family secretion protein